MEAVGDVALGELDGGDDGLVADAHVVVVLVALFEAAEDGDGRGLVGFVDHDFLEAALEGFVLLEVFLILVEGGGADRTELAAGEGGFEDVCGIHGTFAFAGADQGVDFVDEEDDFAVGLRHFVDDSFEALFKLAFVLGAGYECAHVEGEDLFGAEILGDVAADDALCETFGDGGFAGAGFADEHGVVLGAARENLKHAAYLLVTADDGVELALACALVQINRVFREGVVGVFGALVGGFLAFAELVDGGLELALCEAGVFEDG